MALNLKKVKNTFSASFYSDGFQTHRYEENGLLFFIRRYAAIEVFNKIGNIA